MNNEYMLISDDDGHWYVIPADKVKEYEKYLAHVYAFYEMLRDDEPIEPDWVIEVGGAPGRVKFKVWRIE